MQVADIWRLLQLGGLLDALRRAAVAVTGRMHSASPAHAPQVQSKCERDPAAHAAASQHQWVNAAACEGSPADSRVRGACS